MPTGSFAYRNSTISYSLFGSGPAMVLCFHGFGEDSEGYAFLGRLAGQSFSFLAIELPFHGGTEWREGLDFSSGDLQEIANRVFVELGQSVKGQRFSIMGFSLGGRVALSLYELMPDRIDRMILMAPDGLRVNGWYWLATQTWVGNRLFQYTMRHPGWFFFLLKALNRVGLVNASVYKFVQYYIGDAGAREVLYKRWTTLRKLRPRLSGIKQSIREYRTTVRLLYGRHDRIILPKRGEQFRVGIEEYCRLTVIDAGHQVLHEKHAEEIIRSLGHS